jgi:uncharacterized protein YjbI with pentapeptide repeats
MANPQQIAKLNDGFTDWNSWRASNDASIDLTDTSLDGRDFTNFDLRDANFKRARLRGANFSSAELHGATFDGSDLSDATFNGAGISESSFRGANLRCADLSNVRGALEQEQLAGADLTAA